MILSVGVLSIFFSQCKKENEAVTKHGFKYMLFKQGKGDLIKAGDITYLAAQLIHVTKDGKDSIIIDTRTNPTPFEFVMPPDSQVTQATPIVDILPLMRVGDSAIVFQSMDSIKNKEPFMKDWKFIKHSFKVLQVMNEADRKAIQDLEPGVEKTIQQDLADMKGGKLSNLKTSENGVQVLVHEPGTSTGLKEGEPVKVYYYGVTKNDGKMFDSAFKKGAPFTFTLGRGEVIRGWDEGIALLNKGAKATIFIPSKLAYGEKGIPGFIEPNSDLVFYVQVL